MLGTGFITIAPNTRTRDRLKIAVTAVETRNMFSRTEYLVVPVGGSGQCWKTAESIEWTTAPEGN